MRLIAKAPSAGSSQGQGSRLGRIFRGALATRGASPGAEGSSAPSAPSHGRTGIAAALATACALAILLIAPAGASAFTKYSLLGEFGETGCESGQLGYAGTERPQRIDVDQGTGYLYVANTACDRIDVFDPEGFETPNFKFSFGSLVKNFNNPVGVAIDQETGDFYATSSLVPAANEKQLVTLTLATGGTFALKFGGEETGAEGEGTETETTVVTGVTATTGAFTAGSTITGGSIPPGTKIETVAEPESEVFTLTLSQIAPGSSTTTLSADLGYNASGFSIGKALEALGAIGEGNIAVSPPSIGGPYTVEFKGTLAGTNVAELVCDGTGLTGVGAECTVATTTAGHPLLPGKLVKFIPNEPPPAAPAFYTEVGAPGFTSPAEGGGATEVGSFGYNSGLTWTPGIAVDPTSHEVLIADGSNARIDRIASNGVFEGSFDGSNGGEAFVEPIDVAANSAGDAIVADLFLEGFAGKVRITRYSGGGEWQAELTTFSTATTAGAAVAADPASGEVFAAHGDSPFFGAPNTHLWQFEADAMVAELTTPVRGVWGLAVGPGPLLYQMGSTNSLTTPQVRVFVPNFALTVTLAGTGEGSVESELPGIECDPTCEEKYAGGTTVTLTGTPDPGSKPVVWSGACSGEGVCEVTMDEAKEVIATFDLKSMPFEVIEEGEGTVECEDEGGGLEPCKPSYLYGHEIEVVAAPLPGNLLESLTGSGSAGGCAGSPCSFTIEEESGVSAVFVSANIIAQQVENVHGEVLETTELATDCANDVDLGIFTPGIENHRYWKDCNLTVTSTGEETTLTAADETGFGKEGHLSQEPKPAIVFNLPEPLEMTAESTIPLNGVPNGELEPLNAGAVTLMTYPTPVNKDNVKTEFSQWIMEHDPLHTGVYSKEITLTLKQTTP